MIYVKPDSYVARYMEFCSAQETPYIYDLMGALWTLSIAMGRGVVVARPRAEVHLNMYVCLVSDSGIMRKSTAVRIATSIVRELMKCTSSTTLLIESKVTMGMLQNELSRSTTEHGQAHIVISASELAAVLARSGGMSGIPALLTDLYDCPDVRVGGGSLHSGSYNFKSVYAAFLGGSTPAWLARAVSPDIIEGGFTSRCYFILGNQRKRSVAWPSPQDGAVTQRALVEELADLQAESKRYNEIGVTDGALKAFTHWYNTRSSHRDPYRESFEAREDAHVLRFAGLYAINERAWKISEDHILRAVEQVRQIKRDGAELFSGVSIHKDEMHVIAKTRALLLAAGADGLSRTEIYRGLAPKVRSGELDNLLTVLHELDLVKKHEVVLPRGRPKHVFTATQYLRSDEMLREVSRKLGME